MPQSATAETFESLVGSSKVLIDFWGTRCHPCLQMMPSIEALEQEHDGALQVVKVNATENRNICRDLRVMGLPTYVFYRDGVETERLTGDPTLDDIKAAVARLES